MGSRIAHCLIPKIDKLEEGLRQLCKLCAADELVLFGQSRLLEISHVEAKPHKDPHRFEKISNIITQFKLSLLATNYQLQEMMFKNSKFRAYLLEFTKSAYLMVIMSNTDVEEAVIKINVDAFRPYYEKIVSGSL